MVSACSDSSEGEDAVATTTVVTVASAPITTEAADRVTDAENLDFCRALVPALDNSLFRAEGATATGSELASSMRQLINAYTEASTTAKGELGVDVNIGLAAINSLDSYLATVDYDFSRLTEVPAALELLNDTDFRDSISRIDAFAEGKC